MRNGKQEEQKTRSDEKRAITLRTIDTMQSVGNIDRRQTWDDKQSPRMILVDHADGHAGLTGGAL